MPIILQQQRHLSDGLCCLLQAAPLTTQDIPVPARVGLLVHGCNSHSVPAAPQASHKVSPPGSGIGPGRQPRALHQIHLVGDSPMLEGAACCWCWCWSTCAWCCCACVVCQNSSCCCGVGGGRPSCMNCCCSSAAICCCCAASWDWWGSMAPLPFWSLQAGMTVLSIMIALASYIATRSASCAGRHP